ncbi:MAG: hypothetical protein HOV80_24880 [Polyangiaceae bacterium]|nr:hypothetical protein [Polyangiaceae bacterium]
MLTSLVVLASFVACDGEGGGATGGGGVGGTASSTGSATVSTTATTDSTTAGATGGGGNAPEPPPFDEIPWSTGDDVGYGVAFKDTQNPLGEAAFIGYAGYQIPLETSEAWVREVYLQALQQRGVRYVFAVQGPADVTYAGFEIGNSKIAASLSTLLSPSSQFVLVLGHSSGSYVAHELISQLAGGFDTTGVTNDKLVYFNLDGAVGGLDGTSVDRLRKAYFVGAVDGTTGTGSPNLPSMQNGGATYQDKGGYIELDVSGSGCNPGATWCVHMTLITTLPHDPADASGILDYSDFEGRPVSRDFIDDKAMEADLD